MPGVMRFRTAHPGGAALATLAAALLLGATACTGSTNASSSSADSAGSGAAADAGAPAGAAPAAAAAPAATSAAGGTAGTVDVVTATRSRIRTAALTVEVKDVSRASDDAIARARAVGGFLGSQRQQAQKSAPVAAKDGPAAAKVAPAERVTATLVLQVPPDHLDAVLAQLAGLGTVTGSQRSETDVTGTVADLDARLATDRASLTRLRALFTTARDLKQITALEQALTNRESEFESLQGRQRALSAQIQTAAVSLNLLAPVPATPIAPVAPHLGFVRGLAAGWAALLGSGRIVAAVTGALIPFLPIGALAVFGVLVWRRRQRHRTG